MDPTLAQFLISQEITLLLDILVCSSVYHMPDTVLVTQDTKIGI